MKGPEKVILELGLMKTSSLVFFWWNEAEEVIEANEAVEVIEANKVFDARFDRIEDGTPHYYLPT